MEDLPQEAVTLNMLGRAFMGLGDYAQAQITHERALSIARELADRRGELVNTGNLARMAVDLGNYSQAIDYYTQVLDICRETDDTVALAITLGNLGEAYRQLSEFDIALDYFAQALQVNRAIGRQRGEGYALQCQGLTLLETGDPAEARRALEKALAIRVELGERDNLLENHAALALAFLAEGRLEQAQSSLQAALKMLDPEHDRGYLRQWVHYVAYRVFSAQGRLGDASQHILQAQTAMLDMAEPLPADDRTRFLQTVPLNWETQAALDSLAHKIEVRLVRADVPLGRKLLKTDYIPVTWTVYAPEDDLIQKKAGRRRQALQRIIAEAKIQGAAPTDDDLAAALGVSRRTILRDIQALSQAGVVLPTRRRTHQA
jgi:tetratricopeptide (TPR) repeat protein